MADELRYMNKAVLGIGGNLPSKYGTCLDAVYEAIHLIAHIKNVSVIKQSAIYRTKAWPEGSGQADYANLALLIETHLSAGDALKEMQSVEEKMGRVRDERWGSRIIDIDILAFSQDILPSTDGWREVVDHDDPAYFIEEVTIPHPRLHKRAFALMPFVDVYPEWHHPVLDKTVRELAGSLSIIEKQSIQLY